MIYYRKRESSDGKENCERTGERGSERSSKEAREQSGEQRESEEERWLSEEDGILLLLALAIYHFLGVQARTHKHRDT
jgi:hypothetical protein